MLELIDFGKQVRREKISERMKFLQDLVPGCSKVVFVEIKSLKSEIMLNSHLKAV